MTSESNPSNAPRHEECIVCGKDMAGTRASATFYVEGRPHTVCCPFCLEAYQKSPELFAKRASAKEARREAQRLLGMNDIS